LSVDAVLAAMLCCAFWAVSFASTIFESAAWTGAFCFIAVFLLRLIVQSNHKQIRVEVYFYRTNLVNMLAYFLMLPKFYSIEYQKLK
jgi:hypothetical protein